jgi:hypothetical protein
MTVTTQNDIHEGNKNSLNPGDASYHLVQNLLFSHLLSKDENIENYNFTKLICMGVKLDRSL